MRRQKTQILVTGPSGQTFSNLNKRPANQRNTETIFMAILVPSTNQNHPFAQQLGDQPAPVGTFVATILAVKDELGVRRQKFESSEMETVNMTCFLFGFRDTKGLAHKVASRQMRISGNEKSALFGFLKNLLGRAPAFGWDYCQLKGEKCLLTVEHVERRDGSGVFAAVTSLSPLPAGMDRSSPQTTQAQARPQPDDDAVVTPPVQTRASTSAVPCVAENQDNIPF
jgi:hypothetical protein